MNRILEKSNSNKQKSMRHRKIASKNYDDVYMATNHCKFTNIKQNYPRLFTADQNKKRSKFLFEIGTDQNKVNQPTKSLSFTKHWKIKLKSKMHHNSNLEMLMLKNQELREPNDFSQEFNKKKEEYDKLFFEKLFEKNKLNNIKKLANLIEIELKNNEAKIQNQFTEITSQYFSILKS